MRARVRWEQPLCLDCEVIGVINSWDELDHIVPLEKGGSNERKNLVGKCFDHHHIKTAKDRGYKQAGACDAQGFPLDDNHYWNNHG